MNVRTIAAAAALLLLFPVAGCGGNSDDDTAATNISAALVKSGDSSFKANKKQADCFGKELVDKVGTKDLQKYKVLDKNLKANAKIDQVKMSKTDANGAADALVDCVDAKSLILDQLDSSSVPAEAKKCIGQALTKPVLRDLMAAQFAGEDATSAAQSKLTAPLMKCMTASLGQ